MHIVLLLLITLQRKRKTHLQYLSNFNTFDPQKDMTHADGARPVINPSKNQPVMPKTVKTDERLKFGSLEIQNSKLSESDCSVN